MLSLHRRTVVLLGALSLMHVLLISYQVQSHTGVPVLQSATFGVWAKVQGGTTAVLHGIAGFWSRLLGVHKTAVENDALRQRVVQLEGEVEQQRALASRTHALESALGLQQSVAGTTLAARVIAGDPTPGSLTVTIDKGADDGVAADMAVIARGGVVGRVIGRPTAHAAHVQLLTGANAAAGGVIERTQAGGVVIGGAGTPALRMDLFSNASDVRAGDRVLTSGQDGIFPAAFVIGVVERTDPPTSAHRYIAVRPEVDFSYLDVVLVLTAKPAVPGLNVPKDPAPSPPKGSALSLSKGGGS